MSGYRVFSVLNANLGDLDPIEKLIALFLADWSPDPLGFCWPENDWFCLKIGLKTRQVTRWLRRMENEGYLKVYERHNHHNLYVLAPLPNETVPDAFHIVTEAYLKYGGKSWRLREPQWAETDPRAAEFDAKRQQQMIQELNTSVAHARKRKQPRKKAQ